MVEHLNAENFKSRVHDYEKNKTWEFQGDLPAIIDFYADWCGPCKAVAPVMDKLSVEFEGRVNFYKIDTDKEQLLASLFGISSIPSLLFVPMEGPPSMSVGALPEGEIKKAIEQVLKVDKATA